MSALVAGRETEGDADALPRLERYEVVREIGRGGMAVVYLARQTDLDRDVSLKELRLFDAADACAARRFVRESRVCAALTHPHIVTVHDYFEHDGTPYIAMEYFPRGSLRPYVGRTSVAESIGVLEGVLAGLDHAARHGIVHRDIKPENLMITVEGRVKLADFGIARAGDPQDQDMLLTMAGVPVGTPAYMAPEQAVGEEVGPWTDLYSVGVLAWELFVGHLPFRDTPSRVGLLLRNVNEAIPSACTVEPSVDPAISAWIDRLLAKDPEQRVRSAAEAWDQLEDIATGVLGVGWRRQARLRNRAGATSVESPLTPAPFTGSQDAGELAAPAAPLADQETPIAAVALATLEAAPAPAPAPAPTTARWPELAPGQRAVALGALAVIVAILAGWLLGGRGEPASGPVAVEGSGLRVSVPADWTRRPPAPPHIPGLTPTGVVAGPDDSGRTGIEAGLVTYHPPSLLSAQTRAAVAGPLPAPVAVRLGGGVEAYRYDRLRLDTYPGVVTIYAVPTTDWVATLACYAPAGLERHFEPACAAIAATLRPTSARPVPVGPSTAFADRLARALAELRNATTAPRRELERAVVPADGASAARALARAYAHTATVLDNLPDRVVDGVAAAGLAGGVSAVADAYEHLAAAARAGTPAGYERTRGELAATRAQLRKATRPLTRAGYEVR